VTNVNGREPSGLFTVRTNPCPYDLYRTVRTGVSTNTTAYTFTFIKFLKPSEPVRQLGRNLRIPSGNRGLVDILNSSNNIFQYHGITFPGKYPALLPIQGSIMKVGEVFSSSGQQPDRS
jgi:hypothetical protein